MIPFTGRTTNCTNYTNVPVGFVQFVNFVVQACGTEVA
jgi:hypothetical protein